MSRRAIPGLDRLLLDKIGAAVREIEPAARIILYGSRARGDAAPDSDWDILVLLPGPVDDDRDKAVCRRLYRLELDTDTVINVIAFSENDWESPLYRAMPFHANVDQDGIAL